MRDAAGCTAAATGPAFPVGLAAAALGRLDAAVDDLEAAASLRDANGARGYGAQARVVLAAALTG